MPRYEFKNKPRQAMARSLLKGDYGVLTPTINVAGESWEECAAREVKEETGLSIHNLKFAYVTNTVMRDEIRPSHYVTIFMRGELVDPNAVPENMEPEKCDGWEWVEWPNMPQPVFRPLQSLIDSNYQLS